MIGFFTRGVKTGKTAREKESRSSVEYFDVSVHGKVRRPVAEKSRQQ